MSMKKTSKMTKRIWKRTTSMFSSINVEAVPKCLLRKWNIDVQVKYPTNSPHDIVANLISIIYFYSRAILHTKLLTANLFEIDLH